MITKTDAYIDVLLENLLLKFQPHVICAYGILFMKIMPQIFFRTAAVLFSQTDIVAEYILNVYSHMYCNESKGKLSS